MSFPEKANEVMSRTLFRGRGKSMLRRGNFSTLYATRVFKLCALIKYDWTGLKSAEVWWPWKCVRVVKIKCRKSFRRSTHPERSTCWFTRRIFREIHWSVLSIHGTVPNQKLVKHLQTHAFRFTPYSGYLFAIICHKIAYSEFIGCVGGLLNFVYISFAGNQHRLYYAKMCSYELMIQSRVEWACVGRPLNVMRELRLNKHFTTCCEWILGTDRCFKSWEDCGRKSSDARTFT